MLAVKNGHKDVVEILTKNRANIDVVNNVSVHVHMLYDKSCISEFKRNFFFLKSGSICYTTTIISFEILSF